MFVVGRMKIRIVYILHIQVELVLGLRMFEVGV